jgi:predicted dehydrogenase
MKTINIGLIGTGFMGKGHSVAFKKVPMIFNPPPAIPNLAIVADISEELARQAAENFGFDEWVVGWQDLVATESIDVVDITTPNHLHKEIALAAAKAGKHIYCEKPLAVTAADAKEMVEAAEKAGVKTMVGFNYLKNPATLLAKQMIDSGELGEIYHFRGSFHEDVLADPNQPFSWRFDRNIAGSGALGDLGAHVIEIARALVGEFGRVSALTKTFIMERPVASGSYGYDSQAVADGPKRAVENEDVVHFLVEFENGATGVIESSRIAAGRKVFLAYELNGSEGSLYFVHERLNELKVYFSTDPAGRHGFRTIYAGPEHPYYKSFWPVAGMGLGFEDAKVIEVYELLLGLAEDRPIYPDFYAGWKVCQIIDAVLRSAKERQWVDVSEI